MEQFKYGDKVTHQLYGKGKVANTYPEENLVQVFFEGQGLNQMLMHPVSLTKTVTVQFEARIEWKRGAVTTSQPLDAAGVKQYLSQMDLEDMDSYTVTRIKSTEERTADYLKSMAAEDDD